MNYIYAKSNINFKNKITIFAIPKPFVGHIGVIQYNAIFSWTLLKPRPDIFLFGNERGTKDICEKLKLNHVPKIQRNQYNTPLLNSVFAEIHHRVNNNIIAYLNADIILKNDFCLGVQSVSQEFDDYLLIGRRWNIEIFQKLAFESNWEFNLEKLIKHKGCLADCDCKDYFVFPKHLFAKIPPFAVGRGYWDTWMVRNALENGYPVVDGSLVINAIHQDHPYAHIRGGRNAAYMGKEAQINKAIGNVTQPGNIACATWQLKPLEYKDLPTVSVIIIVDEQCTSVEKTVSSVLLQTYNDYEIIVIDKNYNCQIDSVWQHHQDKIRYFYLKNQNADIYACGLKLARGEFITFLEAGSALLPEALEKQVKSFEKEASTLDILLCDRELVEENKIVKLKLAKNTQNTKHINIENYRLIKKLADIYMIMFRKTRLDNIKSFNLFINNEIIQIFSSVFIEELKIKRLKFSSIIEPH